MAEESRGKKADLESRRKEAPRKRMKKDTPREKREADPKEKTAKSVRQLVLESLMDINEEGTYSNEALRKMYQAYPDLPRADRNLYTALVEGTLEHLLTLDHVLGQVSRTPVFKMDPLVRNLVRLGAYQILYIRMMPDYAVCNESVELAKKNGFTSASGFVNGVLRNLVRKKKNKELTFPNPARDPEGYLSVAYSMPKWIVSQWLASYGFSDTRDLLKSLTREKPLCAWANTTRFSTEEVEKELENDGVTVEKHPYIKDAFLMRHVSNLEHLSAFQKGMIYLQDTSSILAASLGGVKQGDRVLDVCGAPGGKSLYLANQLEGTGEVVCRDLSQNKVSKIQENIRRMGFKNIKAQKVDACELRPEDIETADLVVADLPCSGLGVCGRKSDIRYRLKPGDFESLSTLQRRILEAVSQYVKPGGKLLLSTCTFSKKENEENRQWVLDNLPFTPVPIEGVPAPMQKDTQSQGYLQMFPQDAIYHDGFFLALFQRKADA